MEGGRLCYLLTPATPKRDAGVQSAKAGPILCRGLPDPVRLALVGFGYWGPNYARVLSDLPAAELVLICEANTERVRLARDRYRSIAVCADAAAVFARDDLDAVVIATPASTHAALGRAALERGFHVLVEKPMALDPPAAESPCALAESTNRV